MDYFACEEMIDGGWATYVQVGLAFATIRDRRLYRAEFATFEEYCRNRWQYGRAYVNRLISGAKVFTHLASNGRQKPEHERQVRPLLGLPPEQAQLAWDTAVQRAGGKTVTARLLKTWSMASDPPSTRTRSLGKSAPPARPSAASSTPRLANCCSCSVKRPPMQS